MLKCGDLRPGAPHTHLCSYGVRRRCRDVTGHSASGINVKEGINCDYEKCKLQTKNNSAHGTTFWSPYLLCIWKVGMGFMEPNYRSSAVSQLFTNCLFFSHYVAGCPSPLFPCAVHTGSWPTPIDVRNCHGLKYVHTAHLSWWQDIGSCSLWQLTNSFELSAGLSTGQARSLLYTFGVHMHSYHSRLRLFATSPTASHQRQWETFSSSSMDGSLANALEAMWFAPTNWATEQMVFTSSCVGHHIHFHTVCNRA